MSVLDKKHTWWQQYSADINAMLLNSEADEFEASSRAEILNYLPSSVEGKQILELGAGIGRFTKHFASVAKHVVAVDFVEKFIT